MTIKVLITGAGAPGIRGTLYSLKNNWDRRKIITIGVDMREDVVGKYLCNSFYKIPPANDQSFISTLLEICEKEEVDVVLPQVTDELPYLSRYKGQFEEIGVKVAVSEYTSIELANNKYKLIQIARKVKVPAPKTFLVKSWSDLEKAVEKIGYPFVVKPAVSSGMRGFRIVYESLDKKLIFFNEKPDSTKITIDELYNILGENFPELLVMEYLSGKEYTVDVLSTKEDVYVVIPRSRDQIRTGITFAGTVEKRDDIIDYTKRLTKALALEFAHGFQFKEDNEGTPKIIESNPRIQGTMVLSTVAGANVIYGAVKLALGEDIPEFKVRWGTRLLRYWGGIGVYDGITVEI